MKRNTKIVLGVVVLIVVGLLVYSFTESKKPGKYDEFAKCLSNTGTKFYGTFWCPHCQNQKRMFGNSSKLLPYVECSTPDGRNATEICIEKKIEGYPTWEFPNGDRVSGEMKLEDIASKSSCVLPNK